MIRIIAKRRRGRPTGRPPLLVEDFVRSDATALLARSRGYQGQDEEVVQWRVGWTDWGRPRARTVPLPVTTTPQPLGGVRRWWRCPRCDRRCGVLLAATPDGVIGCRACLRARYAGDYPGRDRNRRFVALLQSMAAGSLDATLERELRALSARRRRGVRRGRRVTRRAIRLWTTLHGWPDTFTDLMSAMRRA